MADAAEVAQAREALDSACGTHNARIGIFARGAGRRPSAPYPPLQDRRPLVKHVNAPAPHAALLSLAALHEISTLLNTGLDKQTLAIVVSLCENGVNPEALAAVIQEMRREAAAAQAGHEGPAPAAAR